MLNIKIFLITYLENYFYKFMAIQFICPDVFIKYEHR